LSAENLGLFGIFTAVAALLATLWQGYLLRCQLGHFVRVSRAQFLPAGYDDVHTARSNFIEHPDLWAYFYDGRKEPRGTAQRAKVSAMARILANLADGLASETVNGDFDKHWNKYY
jgi:hypothetical protein